MKQCTSCKDTTELTNFNKKSSSPDGLQNICKYCSRKRSRRYYQENHDSHLRSIMASKRERVKFNQTFILDYLSTHHCVDCGEKRTACLEFDHVRPGKKYMISKMVMEGYALQTIQKEIALCDVRCANCHRIKTAKDQRWFSA